MDSISLMIEILKQKQFITPLEQDILDTWNELRKGVFAEAKFDSKEGELTLARVLDRDEDVLKWLRPAPNESFLSLAKQFQAS